MYEKRKRFHRKKYRAPQAPHKLARLFRKKKAFHLPKASLCDKTETVSGWAQSDSEHWGNLRSSRQKIKSNCQEKKLWIRSAKKNSVWTHIYIGSFRSFMGAALHTDTHTLTFTNGHTIQVSGWDFFSTRYLDIGLWNGQHIFAGWPATINWLCCGCVGILNLYSQHSIPALSDDMNKLLFSGGEAML